MFAVGEIEVSDDDEQSQVDDYRNQTDGLKMMMGHASDLSV